MKVIDLLNKIANGEEVPEKFKFAGQIFKKQGSYILDEDRDSIFASIFSDFSNINDEVAIIEEDKKIKKVSECFTSTDNKEIQFLIDNINQLGNKINEIIDKINEMEDK